MAEKPVVSLEPVAEVLDPGLPSHLVPSNLFKLCVRPYILAPIAVVKCAVPKEPAASRGKTSNSAQMDPVPMSHNSP